MVFLIKSPENYVPLKSIVVEYNSCQGASKSVYFLLKVPTVGVRARKQRAYDGVETQEAKAGNYH
jgi:hypothetical protein